ncbi:MAG TPA: hypothetical protein VE991_11985, partial [Acidimicrobiales bacterium]|nr:hypothetical protein [Acidimicrobiales bacterium]
LLAIMVSTSYLVGTVLGQASSARQRVSATGLAEQWLETLANDPLTTLQADMNQTVTLSQATVAGVAYTVKAYLDWSGDGLAPSLCKTGSPPQVIRATVTVAWEVTNTLSETTVINPPYGTAVPTDGYISVQIVGADGADPPAGVTQVPVQINDGPGGAQETYVPDTNGCVYRQDAPGTYTVQLGSPNGGPQFVDWQEALTPSSSATVVAGLTSFTTFHFDQASVVQFGSSGSPTIATGMPISVGNAQLTPIPWSTVVAAGSHATSDPLFPYPSGYSVWYGDCLAEEPASPTVITTAAGTATTATIGGLSTLQMAVTNSSTGQPMSGATATATVNDSANGCAADVFGLTASDASGNSITALPAETYSVVVTDPADNATTTVALQVTSSGVTVGATTYPDGTPVPVSVG